MQTSYYCTVISLWTLFLDMRAFDVQLTNHLFVTATVQVSGTVTMHGISHKHQEHSKVFCDDLNLLMAA